MIVSTVALIALVAFGILMGLYLLWLATDRRRERNWKRAALAAYALAMIASGVVVLATFDWMPS